MGRGFLVIRHLLWAVDAGPPAAAFAASAGLFTGGLIRFCVRLKKKPLVEPTCAAGLLGLVAWSILGLIWQGLGDLVAAEPAAYAEPAISTRMRLLLWGVLPGVVRGISGVVEAAGSRRAGRGAGADAAICGLPVELRNQFVSGGSKEIVPVVPGVTCCGSGRWLNRSCRVYRRKLDYRGAMGWPDVGAGEDGVVVIRRDVLEPFS